MCKYKGLRKVEYGSIMDRVVFKVAVDKEGQKDNGFMCTALVDTGAVQSCISIRLAKELELTPTGTKIVRFADSHTETVDVYVVDISLSDSIMFETVDVMAMALPDSDVIIGMDLLSQGDTAILNRDGQTFFQFGLL